MALGSIIKVAILGEERGLKEAVHLATEDLNKLQKKAQSTSEKAAAIGKKATLALGAGALALAGIAVKNGDALNESQDQLANALENTGQKADGLVKRLSPLQNHMEKYGFTNVEVNKSLEAQVTSGVKLSEAMHREQLIADLARKKHLDLATATTLVTKAAQGQIKPLRALAIDLPVAAGGAVKLAAAQKGLTKAQADVTVAEDKYHEAQAKANAILEDARKRHLKGAAAQHAYAQATHIMSAASDGLKKAQQRQRDASQKVNDVASAGGKILDTLSKRMKGGAEESTKSLAGKTEALKAKFTDMTAHLGQKLIPILLTVGTKLGDLVTWVVKNKAVLVPLIAAVGAYVAVMTTAMIVEKVSAAIGVLQKAYAFLTPTTEAATTAQGELDVAMDANPIGLVVAAIAALVAGLVIAYQKVGWFHAAVDKMWQLLQTGYHWVHDNWPLLLAILTGPFGLAALYIVNHWDTIIGFIRGIPGKIASIASHMWSGITTAWDTAVHWIGQRGEAIITWITGLPGRAKSAFLHGISSLSDIGSHFVQAIGDGIMAGGHWIKTAIHSLLDQIPGFSAFAGIIDHVPVLGALSRWVGFSEGGIVDYPNSGKLAVLHGREAILPLNKPRRAMEILDQTGLLAGPRLSATAPSGGGYGGGGGNTIINLPAGTSPSATAAAIRRNDKRNGRTG